MRLPIACSPPPPPPPPPPPSAVPLPLGPGDLSSACSVATDRPMPQARDAAPRAGSPPAAEGWHRWTPVAREPAGIDGSAGHAKRRAGRLPTRQMADFAGSGVGTMPRPSAGTDARQTTHFWTIGTQHGRRHQRHRYSYADEARVCSRGEPRRIGAMIEKQPVDADPRRRSARRAFRGVVLIERGRGQGGRGGARISEVVQPRPRISRRARIGEDGVQRSRHVQLASSKNS